VNRARFLEEAEAEFLKEVRYYADVQTKGGERFRMAVEEAAARALAFPMAGQPYRSKTRRVFVKGYPFFLVYRRETEDVAILAVVHEARRPGYWLTRVR
jgi:plasmid stabilization system protein ParE